MRIEFNANVLVMYWQVHSSLGFGEEAVRKSVRQSLREVLQVNARSPAYYLRWNKQEYQLPDSLDPLILTLSPSDLSLVFQVFAFHGSASQVEIISGEVRRNQTAGESPAKNDLEFEVL